MKYLKTFTFEGKNSARKALDKIEKGGKSFLWLDDVAEISVNKRGSYHVHSTWAQNDTYVSGGIGLGTILGGLVGFVFGPGGALAGAAIGGSMGGMLGHHENVKLHVPQLDDFAATLINDTSALLIIGSEATLDEFTHELADYDVKIFEKEVSKELEEALRKAMKH